MTLIAQFAPASPAVIPSPEAESMDLPPDHVWESTEQLIRGTSGAIKTTDLIEIGGAEDIKGWAARPLIFRRENGNDQYDRIAVWYGAEHIHDGGTVTLGEHSILIREV